MSKRSVDSDEARRTVFEPKERLCRRHELTSVFDMRPVPAVLKDDQA